MGQVTNSNTDTLQHGTVWQWLTLIHYNMAECGNDWHWLVGEQLRFLCPDTASVKKKKKFSFLCNLYASGLNM